MLSFNYEIQPSYSKKVGVAKMWNGQAKWQAKFSYAFCLSPLTDKKITNNFVIFENVKYRSEREREDIFEDRIWQTNLHKSDS